MSLDAGLTESEYQRLLRYGWGSGESVAEGPWRRPNPCERWYEIRLFRTSVAVALMGEAGLRVGEVTRLRWQSVWLEEGCVEVLRVAEDVAKGGRSRDVPVSGLLAWVLANWHGVVGDRAGPVAGGWLVMAVGEGRGVTRRSLQRSFEGLSLSLIGRKVTPHALRHFCGNRWRLAGGVSVAQRLLGHASVRTTQLYTHVAGGELVRAVNLASGGQVAAEGGGA